MKTEWNLGMLYKNEHDPTLKVDTDTYGKASEAFAKKYKNKTDYLTDETKLIKALEDYEKLVAISAGPIMYFNYRQTLNAEDTYAEAELNKLSMLYTKYGNQIIFFELSLGKINKKIQAQFLKSEKLKHYKYFLKKIFETSKYDLSEPEEKIMNVKSLPASSLWQSYSDKLLNIQTILYKNKEIPLPEAQNLIRSLPLKERRKLQDDIMKKLKSISYFAEAELNAVYTNKKINDELRGLAHPYSATILGYQNDEKSVLNLVKTVTDHYSISHSFYDLKATLLNVPYLTYADRAIGIGKTKKQIDFNEAYTIIERVFSGLDPEFADILKRFVDNGQVDVFPKKGKSGGAFCSGSTGLPTFVMLNHISNFESVMTFAHEMGHAIHTELSKSQGVLYEHYTISVAEVASTLFEKFVFEEVFETLSEKEKIVALHDRIQDDIQTIFRQIACFNFELDLHTMIREKGAATKEDIAALMNSHMGAYIGPILKLKEEDGYFFVQWSHIRNFFYVYSYAYGQLVSKALYKEYKKDKNFIKEIKKFLSAGGSKSPEAIFKDIGIDTSKPSFFEKGLKTIEDDIQQLKKLTQK